MPVTVTMVNVFIKKNNIFSQDSYDEIIDGINFNAVNCTCGNIGCLQKYGHYRRTVRYKSMRITIIIQRVICTICGRTHAVLLSCFVPYSQIPLEDQIQIIISRDDKSKRQAVLDENILIDDCEVYRIISNFKQHWEQRLLSLAVNITDESLSAVCILSFFRQFMQIHQGKNSLFILPT